MKKTYITVVRLLLVTLFFVFSSCEKDLYENQIQNTYKKKDITFKQFINETGLTNFDTSITIPPKSTDIQGKTADGKYELTDFDIDTDVIKSMEFQQKLTYSLKIHPKDIISENFFNLIVYKKNNIWEKLIIEMKPSPENLNELQNGLTDNFEGQMRKLYDSSPPPPDMNAGCVTITVTISHCQGCEGACDGCSLCVSTLTYNSCDLGGTTPSGGGSSSGGNDSGDSSSSGSGDGTWNNGTGGSTPSPDDIVIEPNLDPTSLNGNTGLSTTSNEFLTNQFLNNLSPKQRQWAIEHPDEYNALVDYMISSNWSQRAKDFVNRMIALCETNNLELDFDINSNNLQTINSLNGLNAIIQNNLEVFQDDTSNNSTSPNPNQFFSTKTIQLTQLHDLVIEVVSNKQPFTLDNSGCTSYFGNIVIGNSWVQTSMSLTNANYLPTKAKITLVGYTLVGIKFDSLDFGIKFRKKITFLIDKNTGAICCTSTENL